jgi:hypothetical protein
MFTGPSPGTATGEECVFGLSERNRLADLQHPAAADERVVAQQCRRPSTSAASTTDQPPNGSVAGPL